MLVLPAAGAAAPAEGELGPPEGPSLPQLSFEPGSYDFGLRQVNSNASQAYLQLRNNGAAVAPVYSLEIAGPGSSAFWIGQSSCSGANLNPNETCSVQVNFNPNDATAYEAQLRAGSEGGTSFSADLSGEGGRAIIGPVSDPISFGATAVGSPGVTRTIEVTNSGNYPGGAFIAIVAGGAVGSFHLLDENCTGIPLSPKATCTLLVNFRPLSTGVKTARLGLFGDSDGGSQITLTGIGTEAEEADAGQPESSGAAAPELRRKHHARSHRHGSGHRYRRGVAALRPSR
ncbi:MAG TPA: choice-of-anchor D domain-containing protein [Solirubrobacterales bacterium]|jgi:hypothetical protein|nr:choice-of-anchor D domain-containing protein [Solirubrobacterales bacterium]